MAAPRRSLPLLGDLGPAPRNPHNGTPARTPGSVRRTSHLNATWPAGRDSAMHIDAAARDLVTTGAGEAVVRDHAELHVTVDHTRVLQSIRCSVTASGPPRGRRRSCTSTGCTPPWTRTR